MIPDPVILAPRMTTTWFVSIALNCAASPPIRQFILVAKNERWSTMAIQFHLPILIPYGISTGNPSQKGAGCLITHLSAGILRPARPEISQPTKGGICALDSKLRLAQRQQSVHCDETMGSSTSNESPVVAELRPQVRDLMRPDRDRSRESLLFFYVRDMGRLNIPIMRISQSCKFAAHGIYSYGATADWIYLYSYEANVRLAALPRGKVAQSALPPPQSMTNPVRW